MVDVDSLGLVPEFCLASCGDDVALARDDMGRALALAAHDGARSETDYTLRLGRG